MDSSSLGRYAANIAPALFLSFCFLLLGPTLLLGLWRPLGGTTLCRLLLGFFWGLKVTKTNEKQTTC
jgi:hypothetical protein